MFGKLKTVLAGAEVDRRMRQAAEKMPICCSVNEGSGGCCHGDGCFKEGNIGGGCCRRAEESLEEEEEVISARNSRDISEEQGLNRDFAVTTSLITTSLITNSLVTTSSLTMYFVSHKSPTNVS